MSSSKQLTGLLTGTFDPVHLGHVAMAQAARQTCGLDEVWFLVNPEPGHKVGVTGFADRVAMVRLAVENVLGLRVGVPGGDGVVRHRMADFEGVMREHSDREFVFIVGADVLAAMVAWEDYEAARARARFVVARRAGALDVALDPRLHAQSFEFTDYAGASSRLIQESLKAGKRPDELDPRVYEYICERRLY